jgi:hypothetical protein
MSQLIHAVKHTIIGREAADLPLRERNSICCLMSGTKQGSWSCRKKIAKERGCSMRVRKVKKGQAATLYPQRHSRRIVPEEEDGCAQDEVECKARRETRMHAKPCASSSAKSGRGIASCILQNLRYLRVQYITFCLLISRLSFIQL